MRISSCFSHTSNRDTHRCDSRCLQLDFQQIKEYLSQFRVQGQIQPLATEGKFQGDAEKHTGSNHHCIGEAFNVITAKAPFPKVFHFPFLQLQAVLANGPGENPQVHRGRVRKIFYPHRSQLKDTQRLSLDGGSVPKAQGRGRNTLRDLPGTGKLLIYYCFQIY